MNADLLNGICTTAAIVIHIIALVYIGASLPGRVR